MRIAFVGDSLTEGIPGSPFFELLRYRFASHTLVNLGRANDTVISLLRRIKRCRFRRPFDLAFLWVGVNDVPGPRSSWSLRLFDELFSWQRASIPQEFRKVYRETLTLLCAHADRVVAVSPLLKGERLDTPWNRELGVVCSVIESLAAQDPQVVYLDLRTPILERLKVLPSSGYLPKSVFGVLRDAFTLRSDMQVDRVAAKRELFFTLDGIHLNSAGARLVADAYTRVIEAYLLSDEVFVNGGAIRPPATQLSLPLWHTSE
ncbi:MAG: hypothetical protein JXB35_16610 [Anaerolineae bacterium]|nr:hypothetical protein [Anaerolineae bacterium]